MFDGMVGPNPENKANTAKNSEMENGEVSDKGGLGIVESLFSGIIGKVV
jgi:hypothetical protein